MSVLTNHLKQYLNAEIVVVMQDNRAFRGELVEFDEESLLLHNVVEGFPTNTGAWEEPTVSTNIKHKVITWHGTFSHTEDKSDIVRLRDVLIRLAGVLRIYEFSTNNLMAPEHVERESNAGPRGGSPANSVSRNG